MFSMSGILNDCCCCRNVVVNGGQKKMPCSFSIINIVYDMFFLSLSFKQERKSYGMLCLQPVQVCTQIIHPVPIKLQEIYDLKVGEETK